MKQIISYGGDTDTNCAVIGAKFGYKSIPKGWLQDILNADYYRPAEFKVNPKSINFLVRNF